MTFYGILLTFGKCALAEQGVFYSPFSFCTEKLYEADRFVRQTNQSADGGLLLHMLPEELLY